MNFRMRLTGLVDQVTISSTDPGQQPITLNAGNAESIVPGSLWSFYSASAGNQASQGNITIETLLENAWVSGYFSTKLINKTGAPTIRGQLIRCQPVTGIEEGCFNLADFSSFAGVKYYGMQDGVVLDDGIPDGSEASVILLGVAEVLVNGTWFAGDYLRLSPTIPGMAERVTQYLASDYVIGKALDTQLSPTQNLAQCILGKYGAATVYELFSSYLSLTDFSKLVFTSRYNRVFLGSEQAGSGLELPIQFVDKEQTQVLTGRSKKRSCILSGVTNNNSVYLTLDGNVPNEYIQIADNKVMLVDAIIVGRYDKTHSCSFKIKAIVQNIGVGGDPQLLAPITKTQVYVDSGNGYDCNLTIDVVNKQVMISVTSTLAQDTKWSAHVDIGEAVQQSVLYGEGLRYGTGQVYGSDI